MTTVALSSVLKAVTFFFIVTLKSNIFLSYMIVSCNDNKDKVYFSLCWSRIVG